MNRIESSQDTAAAAAPGSSVRPEGLTVVDPVQRVLDVTLRREHERRRAVAGPEPGQVLGGQRVQQIQPVRTGDGQHTSMRQVHRTLTGLEPTLLPHRIAEVPGNTGIDTVRHHHRHVTLSVPAPDFFPSVPRKSLAPVTNSAEPAAGVRAAWRRQQPMARVRPAEASGVATP